ncbi:MAG: MBL fold metallo-hydrolase [Dongiaceae bacterium]
MAQQDFSVRFWGVRGSIACPGPSYARYGGNTACLEMRCGSSRLIFDGGTGLRALGDHLKLEEPLDADLFLSHTHLDHIIGIPFFRCLFAPGNTFRLWAGHLAPERSLREVLNGMMAEPLFPVPIEIFKADTSFHDFRAGETLEPKPGLVLRTAPLNHPNGATGYRVEFDGRAICYVTDTEHRGDGPDPVIVDLVRNADLFIYDSSYTDDEYPHFRGWGHSTWQEGVRIAEAASVGRLVIFHHDPSHDDRFMDHVAASAAAKRPGSLVAREGMVLHA